MPRLPGVKDVTRVSDDGLRLPALGAPRPDPTGAALEGFGGALGALAGKMRRAEEDATIRALGGALLSTQAKLLADPPADQSDFSGPDDPRQIDRSLRLFDDEVRRRLEPFKPGPLRARAQEVADKHRESFRNRLAIDEFRGGQARMLAHLDRVTEDSMAAAETQPDLAPAAGARADAALDATAAILDWSDDERAARQAELDRTLVARVLRADIARDPQDVLRRLDEGEIAAALGAGRTAALRREAETARARARTAFESDAETALAAIRETGAGGAALIAKAKAALPTDEFGPFEAQVHDAKAQGEFRHRVRYLTPEAMSRELDGAPPERRALLQETADRVLQERAGDPAGFVMADPTVARWFKGGTPVETAVARRLRTQAELGVATPRALTRDEAQALTAELNALPPRRPRAAPGGAQDGLRRALSAGSRRTGGPRPRPPRPGARRRRQPRPHPGPRRRTDRRTPRAARGRFRGGPDGDCRGGGRGVGRRHKRLPLRHRRPCLPLLQADQRSAFSCQ